MHLFVSFDGDNIGKQVGRARMSDDVSEVRRVDQAINHGNELWRSLALRAAGTILEVGGDEGSIEIGAEHLPEVAEVTRQYAQAVGATVSVGIGMKLSESAKALMVAKLRGKDQIVLWKPEMQAEIDAAPKQSDAQKQSDEYLNDLAKNALKAPGKYRGAHAGFGGHTQPRHQGPAKPQEDHEQAAVLEHMLEEKGTTEPEQTHSADDLEDQLHSAASKQREIDQAHAQKDDSESKQLKSQLVQVLNVVKDKAPVIAQLKQADPEAYGAVMSLVQGVIALGRKVMGPQTQVDSSEPQAVSKAEELEKAISAIPAGAKIREPKRPGNGDYHTVHDYSHVLTPEHKAKGLKIEVHEYGSDEEGPTELRTHLLDKYDGYVGQVSSYIDRGAAGPSVEPHSDLSPNYRGKGLGQSMYEATYAHAKHSFGATHVAGGIHSEDASKLHQRLAQKHGFEYVPRLRPAHQEETEKYPFNDYRYALKQELEPSIHEDHFMGPGGGLVFSRGPLEKGISDIPVGPKVPSEPTRGAGGSNLSAAAHDYSHLLSDESKAAGLKLEVHEDNDKSGRLDALKARLVNQGKTVGYVHALVDSASTNGYGSPRTRHVEPHSHLQPEHRGKGLGMAMYEALYAHAKNVHGIGQVEGGNHSEAADKLHQRLAKKHGFEFVSKLREEPLDSDLAYGRYSYALKQELEANTHEDHFMGPGRGLVFRASDPALEKDETSTHYGKESPACGSVKKRSTDSRWYMTDCPKCKKSPAWQKAKTDAGTRVKEEKDEYSGSPKTPEGFLDKSGGPIPGAPGHIHLNLPAGSVVNGKMRVAHGDGTSSWVQMTSGMVAGSEPDAPLMGANSHPVSSREPGAR